MTPTQLISYRASENLELRCDPLGRLPESRFMEQDFINCRWWWYKWRSYISSYIGKWVFFFPLCQMFIPHKSLTSTDPARDWSVIIWAKREMPYHCLTEISFIKGIVTRHLCITISNVGELMWCLAMGTTRRGTCSKDKKIWTKYFLKFHLGMKSGWVELRFISVYPTRTWLIYYSGWKC